MRVLMTGAGGTVGSALTQVLQSRGDTVVAWDRRQAPPDDNDAIAATVAALAPDCIYHLATASQSTGRPNEGYLINVSWTEQLARLAAERNIGLVFTSSVMVFTDDAIGPFTPTSIPDAADGYGHEKWLGEQAVLSRHAGAHVVRLGWQIGDGTTGNQMTAFLAQQQAAQGQIKASQRWLPACSFLADTATALARVTSLPPGRYLADSNARWSFFAIAAALNRQHGYPWRVVGDDSFIYDQRMLDPRLGMPSLATRLPLTP